MELLEVTVVFFERIVTMKRETATLYTANKYDQITMEL